MRISLAIGALLASHAAVAAPAADTQKQDELDQRLRVIERKLEIQAEDAQARARDGVTPNAGEKGFGLKSADGSYELKLKGLVQADGRIFFGDPQSLGLNDTFTFRRIEPIFELTLGKLVYAKVQPQFAGETASTADVYGELRFHPAFGLRAGKFKEPVSLENLQGAGNLLFVERGFANELAPSRDIGVQVQGDLLEGTASYALGYFNGAPDGRDSVASDTDNRKEAVARIFLEPFKNDPGFLQGFGFGVAGSSGTKLNTVGTNAATVQANYNNTLPRYRSPGQNTIFQYLINTTAPTTANTVVAAGAHTRLSPQLYFYRGSFGLQAEEITSEQEVAINGAIAKFEHQAYSAEVNYVLTGEDAGYRGVKPSSPYTPGGDGWGAFEVGLRYGVLDVDDDVFPTYANPAASVTEARDLGAVLNWYLTSNVRLVFDFEDTQFTGGAAGGDRDREQAVLTRAQFSF